jgi:hypothetical protein
MFREPSRDERRRVGAHEVRARVDADRGAGEEAAGAVRAISW